jgi:16S rRNA (guanine966-N2)-methyltransferase
MTRIIAGAAGGRKLKTPGTGTRPTSDRVREALFSSLEHAGTLRGARVLDLYAGSGALGLEAASRGAQEVVLVDGGREAARACRSNVADLGLPGVSVAAQKVLGFLRRPAQQQVTLAFLDPPYDLAEDELATTLATLSPHLAPGAVVVVERSVRNPEPGWPEGLERAHERRYGDTVLWFAAAGPGPRVSQ